MRVEPWRRTLNQQDSAVYGRYHCQPLPRPSDPRCCHHATPPPGDHVRQGASILCKHGHGAGRETRCNPDSHRASCPATGLRLGGHTYTTFSHQLIANTQWWRQTSSWRTEPTLRQCGRHHHHPSHPASSVNRQATHMPPAWPNVLPAIPATHDLVKAVSAAAGEGDAACIPLTSHPLRRHPALPEPSWDDTRRSFSPAWMSCNQQ